VSNLSEEKRTLFALLSTNIFMRIFFATRLCRYDVAFPRVPCEKRVKITKKGRYIMSPTRRKRRRTHGSGRYHFADHFEEKKILSYYRQLFQSKLLHQKSDEMLKMVSEIY